MTDVATPGVPTLELTFSAVGGDPWEGEATARFDGDPSAPFRVREGLTRQEREDLRWYIEEYMDLPEGGNAVRAARIERRLVEYGKALWTGLDAGPVHMWLRDVQKAGAGRLELHAAKELDEAAFRTPWELLRVGDGDGILLHNLRVTVARRVKHALPTHDGVPDTSGGLRVLVVVCRPDDAGFLDPRYTPAAMLARWSSAPRCPSTSAAPARWRL